MSGKGNEGEYFMRASILEVCQEAEGGFLLHTDGQKNMSGIGNEGEYFM
jgi:hypothetical protein